MVDGELLMRALIVFYCILCVVFMFEGSWLRALYWFGAMTITFSVVMMGTK